MPQWLHMVLLWLGAMGMLAVAIVCILVALYWLGVVERMTHP